MKNKYSVSINYETKEEYEHSYCYSFGTTKGIHIEIAPNAAKIYFEMNVIKTFDDFSNLKIALYKDAYVKCYLLHVILYKEPLIVKKVCVQINEKTAEFDETYDNFPFLFSMITKKNLEICDEWKQIDNILVQQTKSKMNEDNRYVAIYAYFMSKSREYEFDRFQNLWTSMNAIYNYVGDCFEKSIIQEFGLNNRSELNNNLKIKGKDGLCLGLLSYLIGGKYRKITPQLSVELKYQYLNFEKEICKYNDIKCLYNDFTEQLNSSKRLDKYEKLYNSADEFNVPLYVFMILGYPYYWRCRYLHGNSLAPLFMAYNEDDLKILQIMNYFLDRFIDKTIPMLFSEKWDEEKYKCALKYLEECESDIYKNYNKEKKKH